LAFAGPPAFAESSAVGESAASREWSAVGAWPAVGEWSAVGEWLAVVANGNTAKGGRPRIRSSVAKFSTARSSCGSMEFATQPANSTPLASMAS